MSDAVQPENPAASDDYVDEKDAPIGVDDSPGDEIEVSLNAQVESYVAKKFPSRLCYVESRWLTVCAL